MTRRSNGFLGTALASAALSATLILISLWSRPTDADAALGQKRHDAVTKDVVIDGKLRRDGSNWVVLLTAVNKSDKLQECGVSTSVKGVRSNPMSRVMPSAPAVVREVWKTVVAMKVPAKGQGSQTIAVPDEIAKQIDKSLATRAPTIMPMPMMRGQGVLKGVRVPGPMPARPAEWFNVRLSATCDPPSDDHIS